MMGEFLYKKKFSWIKILMRIFNYSTKLTKKDIILKLKQFWKKKDQSITMDKLCEGLSRITSAGVFFELLGKQKKIMSH